jgi:signal peptidase I
MTLRVLKLFNVAVLLVFATALIALHIRGVEFLSVQTNSMTPTFKARDVLVVLPADVSTLRPGQVISYHSPTNPRVIISHRLIVIDHTRGRLTTAGDANGKSDPTFSQSLLVGRAYAVMPKFGYVLETLRNLLALIILIFLPAILIIFLEIKRLIVTLTAKEYR